MKGNEIQMNDTDFKNELLSWMRFNKRQVETTHNGLSYRVFRKPATSQDTGTSHSEPVFEIRCTK